MILVKSAPALDYQESFISQTAQIPKGKFQEKQPLSITLNIYYQSRRSDLSDELFCDMLQMAQIIYNDRQITEKHLYHHIDRNNPRVEATISSL